MNVGVESCRHRVLIIIVVVRETGVGLDLANIPGLQDGADRHPVIFEAGIFTQIRRAQRTTGAIQGFRLPEQLFFVCGQRRRRLHHPAIIFHLGQGGHARKYCQHAFQVRRKTQGPGRNGLLWLTVQQQFFCRRGQLGQAAAFDGLHDDDLAPVLADHFVTFLSLDQLAVPVHIVQGNLDKFHFRMFRQDPVQKLGRAMERKAQMLNLALGLPLFGMLKKMGLFHDAALAVDTIIVHRLNIMQQIVVNIIHAQVL